MCFCVGGDIGVMLENIGHVIGSECIIDAGSFCAIRKRPGHPSELRYCHDKYQWRILVLEVGMLGPMIIH